MSGPSRHGLGAVAPLTASVLIRLLREGMVRRALSFPVVLIVGTLLSTIGVVVLLRGAPVITVDAPEPAAAEALRLAGFWLLPWQDVEGPVRTGLAAGGLRGERLTVGVGRQAILAEATFREARGAAWSPEAPPPPPLPGPDAVASSGQTIATLLLSIFVLYGVVFGAGLTARDRDDGTLALELSLATPRWVHGAARLIAGSLVLSIWVILGVAFVGALLGLPHPASTLADGVAGAVGAVALGLATVGRAGIKVGFASSLALGLVATTALLGLGAGAPAIGRFLPLASIAAGGVGGVPLALALAMGAGAVWVFTARSARA